MGEDLDVLAEITVGELQPRLQIGEVRLMDLGEDHEQSEPGPLVDDVVQVHGGGDVGSLPHLWCGLLAAHAASLRSRRTAASPPASRSSPAAPVMIAGAPSK